MAAAAGSTGSSPLYFPSAATIIDFGKFDKCYEIAAAEKMAGTLLIQDKELLEKELAARVSSLEFVDAENTAKIVNCFYRLIIALEKDPKEFIEKARFPNKERIHFYAKQNFDQQRLADGQYELIKRLACRFAVKDAYMTREEIEKEVKQFAEEFEKPDCPIVADFFEELANSSIDEFEKLNVVSVGGKATISAAAEPTEEK